MNFATLKDCGIRGRKSTSRECHPWWQNEATRWLQNERGISAFDAISNLEIPRSQFANSKISEENYVNILLEECYSRGLLGWLNHTTTSHVVDAIGSFENWQTADPFQIRERAEDGTDATAVVNQKRKARELERKELLEYYHNSYCTPVQEHARLPYFQLGGPSDEWLAIKQQFPHNTLLHWMAALWKREENARNTKTQSSAMPGRARIEEPFSDISEPDEDEHTRLIILGDVPQEPGYEGDDGVWDMIVKPVHTQFYINRFTSFTEFQKNITESPLIRYHITKYSPDLANALFVADDKVYPPGLHSPWDEEGNTTRPERFQKRSDLVYDNGPGRGWWSGIINTSSQLDPTIFYRIGWGALDTESDWTSLLQTLKSGQGTRVAYLYHLSVRERIRFIQEQVNEERRYVAEHHGYKMFNFLLKRHRDEEKNGGLDSLCGGRKGLTDTMMENL